MTISKGYFRYENIF